MSSKRRPQPHRASAAHAATPTAVHLRFLRTSAAVFSARTRNSRLPAAYSPIWFSVSNASPRCREIRSCLLRFLKKAATFFVITRHSSECAVRNAIFHQLLVEHADETVAAADSMVKKMSGLLAQCPSSQRASLQRSTAKRGFRSTP